MIAASHARPNCAGRLSGFYCRIDVLFNRNKVETEAKSKQEPKLGSKWRLDGQLLGELQAPRELLTNS